MDGGYFSHPVNPTVISGCKLRSVIFQNFVNLVKHFVCGRKIVNRVVVGLNP